MNCARDIGLFKPMVEGLGMNAKQTSSVCDRKQSHTQAPFEARKNGRQHTTDFLELLHFLEISRKSGK
jgi:hypothetical protein